MIDTRTPVRVLLVEDNPADARLLAEILSEVTTHHFHLTTVGLLRDAIERAADQDVILLDLSLPDAHGIETVERMLASGAEVPVVVLTGLADEDLSHRAVKAGAQDYLVKHEITPTLVSRTILYAIERKRAEESVKAAQAARRSQFLAEITGVLATSLDFEVLTARFTRALVPSLADVAALEVRMRGVPDRISVAAVDRSIEPAIDGAWLDKLRASAPRSILSVPVALHERDGVGTLTLVTRESGRRFSAEDRLIAEELGRRAALSLENARLYRAAQDAIRARDEVVAMVSHDLRNPLSVIGLTIQLIQPMHQADPPRRDMLVKAHRAYERMRRMLDDLLDLAGIEQGNLRLARQMCDLHMVLTELVELQRPLVLDKRLAFDVDLSPVAGTAAEVDRDRIGQVLANLIGNAVKFTPAGGRIRVRATAARERVVISVADDGPGIDPQHLPHVFDRFWQADNGRKAKDGAGLGLAITKGIIEAHGGTIRAESEVGRGATFSFELPAPAAEVASASRIKSAASL